MKQKRLLCIVSSLDAGGAETYMMKIFRKLPPPYKIDFVVSTEHGYYEDEVRTLGGEIYRVPLRRKHPFKTFFAIKNVVKNNHYQAVLKLCDTPVGVFDLIAAKAGGATGLCVRSCNSASSENALKHVFYSALRPILNSTASVKFAPSRLAAEYTFGKSEVTSGKVEFLNNALDLNCFRFSEMDRNRIRNEFQIADTQMVIGHVGRFNQQKNHAFLLDVFKSYNSKNPNSVLLLVGKGELEDTIREKAKALDISEKIIFTGVRSDVPALLSAMDVFVFPSLYEGMPNTVIEAQATGLQCVIADTITREADITGLVHYLPLGNAKEWASYIDRLPQIARKTPIQQFKENCYDIETVADQFVKLVFRE